MARFGVLIVALALVLSSANGWARDKNGDFMTYDYVSCGEYVDAYSKSTLKGNRNFQGPYETGTVFGGIYGYLSAYNRFSNNGKSSILGSMSKNDARRWMAAWCRDNPSKDVDNAVNALTRKLRR